MPKGKKYERQELKKLILERINDISKKKKKKLDWGKLLQKDKEVKKYYEAARARRFFGHYFWDAYLEKEIGLTATRKVGKYLFPLHQSQGFIESFIRERIKDKNTHGSNPLEKKSRVKGSLQLCLEKRFFWMQWME